MINCLKKMKKKTGKVIKLKTIINNLPIKEERINPLNEKCKEIIKDTIVPLFEDKNLNEVTNMQILYAFSFYLTQELAHSHMPINQIKHAINVGSTEAIQFYLDIIATKHSIIGKVEESNFPKKTIH